MKKVLISGGSGLVGSTLTKILKDNKYQVAILSRKESSKGLTAFKWDYEDDYIDPKAIEFADIIIHLAGENVGNKRWNKEQKKNITDSRTRTTELLLSSIAKADKIPEKFISASATGFYGAITTNKIFEENDSISTDFLSNVVGKWETKVKQANDLGISYNILRTGLVVSQFGGALQKLQLPVKLGLASPLGSGKQWMPWISAYDLAKMYVFLIENDLPNQIFNAVAPEQLTNREFMKTMANFYNRPFILPPVPSFILKLLFGEMSDILLYGSRVSSNKIIERGFKFEYPNLLMALKSSF